MAAFERPSDAVAAALDAQRALQAEPWPDGAELRVRMAVHTGEIVLRGEGNYGGTTLAPLRPAAGLCPRWAGGGVAGHRRAGRSTGCPTVPGWSIWGRTS